MFSVLGVEAIKQRQPNRWRARVRLCRDRRALESTDKLLPAKCFPGGGTLTLVVVLLLRGFIKGCDPLAAAVALREQELSAARHNPSCTLAEPRLPWISAVGFAHL